MALGEAAHTHVDPCEGSLEDVVRSASRWCKRGSGKKLGLTRSEPTGVGQCGLQAPGSSYSASFAAHHPTGLSAVCTQQSRPHVLGSQSVCPAYRPIPDGPDPRGVSRSAAKPPATLNLCHLPAPLQAGDFLVGRLSLIGSSLEPCEVAICF